MGHRPIQDQNSKFIVEFQHSLPCLIRKVDDQAVVYLFEAIGILLAGCDLCFLGSGYKELSSLPIEHPDYQDRGVVKESVYQNLGSGVDQMAIPELEISDKNLGIISVQLEPSTFLRNLKALILITQ